MSVSPEEAAEFCRRLSELPAEKARGRRYRLPTEAEWEHARQTGAAEMPCFGYALRPLHWTVREWTSRFDESHYETMPAEDPEPPPSASRHGARVVWSHPDPFVEVTTFRVVAETTGQR